MLIKCGECGSEVSDTAISCPKCGAPIRKQEEQSTTNPQLFKHRKVSVILFIGIMLFPYIFVWFLLREGYSQKSKIIGFGWMSITLAILVTRPNISGGESGPRAGTVANNPNSSNGGGSSQSAGAIDVDPQRKDKNLAVAMAKQAVPSVLKDPSSAEFGRVVGMSASIACGTVNAKNSFGAMTGQTRFIFDGGRVAIESEEGGLADRWNTVCLDRPHVAPPAGAGGLHWGAKPTANLKQFAPTTDDGFAVYVPKAHPEALDGVTVAEQDFSFEHNKFYSADYYIDGEAARDKVLKLFLKKYGVPQQYDEGKMSYEWNWRKPKTSIQLHYQESHKRTTVTFSRG